MGTSVARSRNSLICPCMKEAWITMDRFSKSKFGPFLIKSEEKLQTGSLFPGFIFYEASLIISGVIFFTSFNESSLMFSFIYFDKSSILDSSSVLL